MKKTLFAAAVIGVMSATGAAQASVVGSPLAVMVEHDGTAGGLFGPMVAVHLYGNTQTETYPPLGTWDLGSGQTMAWPSAVGYDNNLVLDFSAMSYVAFSNDPNATLTVSGLDLDVLPGSVQLLIDGNIVSSGADTGSGFTAMWTPADLVLADETEVIVVWNSVPAPGALACLGLAGVAFKRRRRHG